jgi:hypothetical protein
MTMASNMRKFAEMIAADILNIRLMSHSYARQHHGPTIINKAASVGVQMTTDDLDHLLRLCLGEEVQIEPFDPKVYAYHRKAWVAMS